MPDDAPDPIRKWLGADEQPDPLKSWLSGGDTATATAERPAPAAPEPVRSIADLRMQDEADIKAEQDASPPTHEEKLDILTRIGKAPSFDAAHGYVGGDVYGPDEEKRKRYEVEQSFAQHAPAIKTRADVRAAREKIDRIDYVKRQRWADPNTSIGPDFVDAPLTPQRQAEVSDFVKAAREKEGVEHQEAVDASHPYWDFLSRGFNVLPSSASSREQALMAEYEAQNPGKTMLVKTAGMIAPIAGGAKWIKRGATALAGGEALAEANAGRALLTPLGAARVAKAGAAADVFAAPLAGAAYGAATAPAGHRLEAAGDNFLFFLGSGEFGKGLRGAISSFPAEIQNRIVRTGGALAAEIGAFAGTDFALHGPEANVKSDAVLATLFSLFGLTPRLPNPGAKDSPRAAGGGDLTPAQRAKVEMADALLKVPGATPEHVASYIAGDTGGIPDEVLAPMHVAAEPVMTAYRDATAPKVAPAALVAARTKAHEEGLRGPAADAAVDKATAGQAVLPLGEPEPDVPQGTTEPGSKTARPQPGDRGYVGPERRLTPRGEQMEAVDKAGRDAGYQARRDLGVGPFDDLTPEQQRYVSEKTYAAIEAAGKDVPPIPDPVDPSGKPTTGEPVAPAVAEVAEPPPAPAPKPKRVARVEPGQSLSQFVRAEGGITEGSAGLRGEIEMLSRRGAGTTGLVRRNGGKPVEDLMQSARESGYDVPHDQTPADFLQRLYEDATFGERSYSRETTDFEAVGDQDYRDAMERFALQNEGGDASFYMGDTAEGTTREGEPAKGEVLRETDKSIIVRTPDGKTARIDKGAEHKVEPAKPEAEQMGLVDERPPEPKKPTTPGEPERGAVGGPLSKEAAAKRDQAVKAIKAAAKRTYRSVRELHDWVAGSTAPNISRGNKKAGSLAGSLALTGTTSGLVADNWSREIFKDVPRKEVAAKKQRFIDALVERNLQGISEKFRKKLADAPNDIARLSAQADLDSVKTHFGDKGYSFADQKALDDYWASPEAKEFTARHHALWNGETRLAEGFPAPEEMFKYLADRGWDTSDLFDVDARDEARVNLVALKDASGEDTPYAEREAARKGKSIFSAASPENIREKPHPLDREATGSGQEYLRDYDASIDHTYRKVLDRYTQARLFEELQSGRNPDVVKVANGTEAPKTLGGEEAVEMRPEVVPAKIIVGPDGKAVVPAVHYYAKKSIVPEIQQLLRLNKAVARNPAATLLNAAALFGVADNFWNLALDSMITTSAPGVSEQRPGGLMMLPMIDETVAGMVNNLIGAARLVGYTVRKPADYRERNLRLSNIGAFRQAKTPEFTAAEFGKSWKDAGLVGKAGLVTKTGTTDALGRLSARVHEAGHYILDEAYTALVKRGMAEDTDVGRRDFVNRLGQYSGRAMGEWTQKARDSGFLPFITAQRKGAAEVLRKVTASGGAGTKGVEVRVGQAMKFLTAATAIGVWNYTKTGDVRGRAGVPFGAMDLGYDDEHGNPMYSDVFGDLFGVRQPTTATGARAFFTANRRGTNAAHAVAGSLINSWLVKFVTSPTTGFAFRALTGKNLYYDSRPQTAESPGDAEEPGQLAFAAKEAFQPAGLITAGAKALGVPGLKNLSRTEDPGFGEEVGGIFPSFSSKQGARDVGTLNERIRHRQADEKTDQMISAFKNLTPEKRVEWIRAELQKWTPQEREANLRRLMKNARRP